MAKRVLIVDDEKDILDMYRTIVKRAGYEVETAASGKVALAKLAEGHFDLVFLDVVMHSMSGKEVAEAIRANPKFKNIKIVFLTLVEVSTTGKELIQRFTPIDYIQRPIGLNEFLAKLHSYFS